MKIELEYPFNITWKRGYIVTNPENRKNVLLYNSQPDRTTISYARYLMSVSLKRFLYTIEKDTRRKKGNFRRNSSRCIFNQRI